MMYSAACPKCGGREIMRINGNIGAYGTGNNIQLGLTNFSAVKVNRYICCNCGYSEEWIDPADIPKIRKSGKALRVGRPY